MDFDRRGFRGTVGIQRLPSKLGHYPVLGGGRSVSILLGREKLAPALRNDRLLHDLALVGRHKLQANLTALRTLWIPLVMGVRLFNLIGFADLFIGRCRGGNRTHPRRRWGPVRQ